MSALKHAKCALALLKKRNSSQLLFVFFVLNFKISFDGRVKITVIAATDLAHSIHLYQRRVCIWYSNGGPMQSGHLVLALRFWFCCFIFGRKVKALGAAAGLLAAVC